MAPTKTPKVHLSSQISSTKNVPKRRQVGKGHNPNQDDIPRPTIPGVQKIKSLLRQTRRLLSKEKLAADVRQATERKMRSLEKDLVQAERTKAERLMATRYHKVKFFEKQKVTRKITQVQRQLETCSDKAEKKVLKKALQESRVDLNYIQHYPKARKYISLFPPEVRDAARSESKGKSKVSGPDSTDTDAQREELRRQIRELMERGELNPEPEAETSADRTRTALDQIAAAEPDTRGDSPKLKMLPGVDEDAFFGDDSDESGGNEEDMDDS